LDTPTCRAGIANDTVAGWSQAALGGNDKFFSGKMAQRGGQELLRLAEAIGLGRIEEGDAIIRGPADRFHRRRRVRRSPVATELPGAEGDPRDVEAALAQDGVFHRVLLCET
jgi:hypothetical protein